MYAAKINFFREITLLLKVPENSFSFKIHVKLLKVFSGSLQSYNKYENSHEMEFMCSTISPSAMKIAIKK